MTNRLESEGTRRILVGGRHVTELTVAGFHLTVAEGPDAGQTVALSAASLTVGTDPANDLVLTDTTTSRRHAVFTNTRGGPAVEDLGSTNGTLVNGVRVQSAFVPDGARIQIGLNVILCTVLPHTFVVVPESEGRFEELLGRSEAMREVFALVKQLARTDLPVVITGETGSGKELVARALHRAGPRRGRPFEVLDCGSVVPDLLRSEIFGHERGAFTGAETMRRGVLEAAAQGTVFFDEIGEMGLAVQPHLLRALETREICRLGSQQRIPVDFRIVSATHRDLSKLAREGTFREDLYYRLSAITIHLPALRERREDIPLLAREFVTRCATRLAVPAPELPAAALDRLASLPWPGNVRQLRNAMEALCVLARGHAVEPADVDRVVAAPPARGPAQTPAAPAEDTLEAAERRVILAALASCNGNRKATARKLGITTTTLRAKLRKYAPGEDDAAG